MLISHALPIWNGLLHRRTDRCATKGHLNAGSYREGDINVFCCNYRTVTRGKRSAILIPEIHHCLGRPSCDLVSRGEEGEGGNGASISGDRPSFRAITKHDRFHGERIFFETNILEKYGESREFTVG